ncbi:tyrosine--tRNA ligase [Sodalis-like secondary symbiont of Drepanosiphum platanoidis]|uniref:tyrosine--tRNA ligase n=1 Tax=Sodalis-like secondary symbiont of Drepanosiphum platanoidis TaxID=2994493 RepID=UPI003463D58C
MKINGILKDLKIRGLISQITNINSLYIKINKKPITLYCGFDPTSDSLHLGHLIPILCLRRFQLFGHKPIILIGGATGMIGDPSFKINERILNDKDTIYLWTEKIKKQFFNFLDFESKKNSAIILNNYNWFNSMNLLSFLRNIGKNFSINKMINKESVKTRIIKNNIGISFTEFSYNLLQSYDFAYLNKMYNVCLQIGGSDQWGNITSGIDITYKLFKNKVFGLTVPLITNKNGTKFGKTEKNTIWLDPKKTSPYEFYQFWININDDDVYNFLKFFTFIDVLDINIIREKNYNLNILLKYKKILAEEITKIVHGKKSLNSIKRIIKSLFYGSIEKLKEKDFINIMKSGIPLTILKKSISLKRFLVFSKISKSLSISKRLIESYAISINGKIITKIEYIFNDKDRLYNKYTLIKKGKKNYFLIYWKK